MSKTKGEQLFQSAVFVLGWIVVMFLTILVCAVLWSLTVKVIGWGIG